MTTEKKKRGGAREGSGPKKKDTMPFYKRLPSGLTERLKKIPDIEPRLEKLADDFEKESVPDQ